MADEIQKLKNDIALDNVIIFIGTGVSFYTTNGEQEVSHWKGLLKHGLERCHQLGWICDESFQDFNDKFNSNTAEINDYLSAADQIKHCFENEYDTFKAWLMETIGALSVKRPELIQAIGELRCPILTTNYDSILETVLNKKSLTWTNHDTDFMLQNLKHFILHVYGSYKEPDSVIFSCNDYKQICENEKLRLLVETKTLLFIGYDSDLSDPQFFNLIKWLMYIKDEKSFSIYKLVQSNQNLTFNQTLNVSFMDNIKEIQYGDTPEDLLSFVKVSNHLHQ